MRKLRKLIDIWRANESIERAVSNQRRGQRSRGSLVSIGATYKSIGWKLLAPTETRCWDVQILEVRETVIRKVIQVGCSQRRTWKFKLINIETESWEF